MQDLASLVTVRNQLKSLVSNNLSAVPRGKVKDVNNVIQKFDLLFVNECLKLESEEVNAGVAVSESLKGNPALGKDTKVEFEPDDDVDENLKILEEARKKVAKKKTK